MESSKRSEIIAKRARMRTLEISHRSKTSHIGSSLSIIDILAVLYSEIINTADIKNRNTNRDRVILSKGHAALGLYSIMEQVELLKSKDLDNFCSPGSNLLGHVTHTNNNFVELSTGSLGHGLPFGAGLAFNPNYTSTNNFNVYVIMSDGECNEGTTWETALIANHLKLKNLKVIVDRNYLQSLGSTETTLTLEPLKKKWKSFGWQVNTIDGHSHTDIYKALRKKTNRPTCIIANTIKGKGISFMENNNMWHYRPPNNHEFQLGLNELNGD